MKKARKINQSSLSKSKRLLVLIMIYIISHNFVVVEMVRRNGEAEDTNKNINKIEPPIMIHEPCFSPSDN